MMIVDSQVHLWVKNRQVNASSAHHRQQAVFSKDDLLKEMNKAGVDRVVIVPPGWEDNQHALAAAREHPDRFAVMGRIALSDPASRDLVAGWRSQPGMLGFRLVFNAEHKDLLTQGHADWLWPLAAEAGIPVMVLAPGLLDYVDAVAREHPTLRLVIDHMGCGRNVLAPEAFAHLPRLLTMAEHENVAVKASGIMGYSSEPYPFKDIRDPVRRVIDAFGPNRVFWGTDLSRMRCPYRECITCFTEEMPWLTQDDKELIMGKALCDWIGWKVDPSH